MRVVITAQLLQCATGDLVSFRGPPLQPIPKRDSLVLEDGRDMLIGEEGLHGRVPVRRGQRQLEPRVTLAFMVDFTAEALDVDSPSPPFSRRSVRIALAFLGEPMNALRG